MLLKNKIFVWFVLLVFLAGNIGVAVNKHICYSEGIVEFYFTSEDISCGEHNSSSSNRTATSCCKKPIEEQKQKPDCCNDDVVYAILDIDQLQTESKPFIANIFETFILQFFYYHVACIFTNTFSYSDADAPPLWRYKTNLTLLTFISVFRI
jgi:hypothetical protein